MTYIEREALLEDWRPVKGYEGLYEVSNIGRVRNRHGYILRAGLKKSTTAYYKRVTLYRSGIAENKTIHRMVAEAFIPNPKRLPVVNHKDEDGTNNVVDNLEWCTVQYNATYGTAIERRIAKIRGISHSPEHNQKIGNSLKRFYSQNDTWNKGVPVADPSNKTITSVRSIASNGEVKEYISIADAVRKTGARQQNISMCIAGKRKTAAGYKWERIMED